MKSLTVTCATRRGAPNYRIVAEWSVAEILDGACKYRRDGSAEQEETPERLRNLIGLAFWRRSSPELEELCDD
jgi:hypothetical protein